MPVVDSGKLTGLALWWLASCMMRVLVESGNKPEVQENGVDKRPLLNSILLARLENCTVDRRQS